MLLRRWFQILSVNVANLHPLAGMTKRTCAPFLYCYACPTASWGCPMGNLQNLLATGDIPYFVVGFLAIVGLTVGRMVCGVFCPSGFVQDLLYKVPSRKIGIPGQLSHVRYAVLLGLIVALPLALSVPTESFCKYLCPSGTLFGGIPLLLTRPVLRNELGNLFYWKFAILVVLLGASVISKRPFCRILCPLGAIYGPFNKVSLLRLDVDRSSCTGCDECKDVCPVDHPVHEDPDSDRCIRCLDCTFCPSVRLTTVFGRSRPSLPVIDERRADRGA